MRENVYFIWKDKLHFFKSIVIMVIGASHGASSFTVIRLKYRISYVWVCPKIYIRTLKRNGKIISTPSGNNRFFAI